MKKFSVKHLFFLVIFISNFVYEGARAQDYLSINNESIIFWITKQIIFKDNYEAEAKVFKQNKVRRFHMNYDKTYDYYQNSGTVNKDGYVTGRFYYDTTQIPEGEIIARLNSKNKPSYIFQYRDDGEKFIHFFSYDDDNKITLIADLSDSAYYNVLEPLYSSNKDNPMLNKVLMKRTDEITSYVNFRYNDEGKLISVYKEGNPDLYRIKYEPDKVIITKTNTVHTFEFKNGIFTGYEFIESETKYKYKTKITLNSKGLRETSTNTYDDGESYTSYYHYEYYEK